MAIAMVLAVSAPSSYSPAFFWSPHSSTSARAEHVATLSGLDVERVSSVLGRDSASVPEVHLVFQAEGLSTEVVRQHGAHLPKLDRLLHQSATSLSMPFTTAHDATLFSDADRVVDADAYLKTHSSVFSNGVTDTLVVEVPATGGTADEQLDALDSLVDRVTRAVHAGTHGNYVALLSAKRGAVSHAAHRRLAATSPPVYLHTSPTLLTAQLVMLILFVIFLSGFCCLFSLQTPKRFEEGKEHAH